MGKAICFFAEGEKANLGGHSPHCPGVGRRPFAAEGGQAGKIPLLAHKYFAASPKATNTCLARRTRIARRTRQRRAMRVRRARRVYIIAHIALRWPLAIRRRRRPWLRPVTFGGRACEVPLLAHKHGPALMCPGRRTRLAHRTR
jgi:hypothetical protein